MRDHPSVWKRLTEAADVCQDMIPGMPLIEIAGTGRIYIENYQKIVFYSDTEIHVRVKYGVILITGASLRFTCISKEYLVVMGKIYSVRLEGSGEK